MKAKEIVLLIFIIVAGVFFYHAKTGKLNCDWDWEGHFAFDLEEFSSQESQVIEPPLPALLKVINAHGNVEIQGTEGDKITVTLEKKIWRRNAEEAKKVADNLHLVVTRDDRAVTLTTNRDDVKRVRLVFGVSRGFETNLRLTVPLNTNIDVVNSHGLVKAAQVGTVSIQNLHGEVVASEVSGELKMENSYEDVELDNIHSACDLRTKHSTLKAEAIAGEMTIEQSHGLVRLREVGQKITIDGIHTEVIGEDLTGPLDIHNSYEKISLRRVGPTRIEGHHSPVEANDVNGDLEIRDDYESADFSNVRGNLQIAGKNLTVTGRNIVGQEIYVSSSYENVKLTDFSGKTTVLASHGDVILEPLPLTGPVDVRCEYSPITFYWPAGEQYPLEAQTKNGDIHWRLPGEIAVEEKDSLSVARAFPGLKEKPRILLWTTYSDILIESGPSK
jgi:hypothetical protein